MAPRRIKRSRRKSKRSHRKSKRSYRPNQNTQTLLLVGGVLAALGVAGYFLLRKKEDAAASSSQGISYKSAAQAAKTLAQTGAKYQASLYT